MKKEIELVLPPGSVDDYLSQKKNAAGILKINTEEISAVQIIRRSIDARSKNPVYRAKAIIYINEEPSDIYVPINFRPIKTNKRVLIVGMGPAGMFAALKLIELGIKPVILERGKDVQARRRDLKLIQQFGKVDPDSNYCFGEGGAGTYSDGKLYTRSTKRGDVNRILNILVQHGSQKEILIDAHPHIGSNILPKVVQSIRETIISCGGEVHFQSRVSDFIIEENRFKGLIINSNQEIPGDSVILAAGHSSRDIYELLGNKNVTIEPKPFAVGVRIEHPQKLIDEIQYHSKQRSEYLPASSYNLSCQVNDRGVYSFCMCPGGVIIPASTAGDELVLNGMSVSRRDSMYANSGLVVTVDEKDWNEFSNFGIFAGLEYQKQIEKKAFEAGGRTQCAPAQRVTDFVKNKISNSLPDTSYIPGTVSTSISDILPNKITDSLSKGLQLFDKKMRGYFTEEAQILAAETRTSSPIKVPRDPETLMHVKISGLFPAGEGAGYAGGIVSAAIDGERAAEACAGFLNRP
jgi:uncharacterized protein